MNRTLTPFQVKCEAALVQALVARGRSLIDRRLAGVHETYIVGRISGSPHTIYIYENEAQVQDGGVDARFEAPDYDSPDDLLVAFIAEVDGLAAMDSN